MGPLIPFKPQRTSSPQYSGTYTNPGYGNLTLCDSHSTSEYCMGVLKDFSVFEVIKPPSDQELRGRLYAFWPRIRFNHTRFIHQSENKFWVQGSFLFPHGYGADASSFEEEYRIPGGEESNWGWFAEFVVEDGRAIGFGFTGTVGSGITKRQKTEEGVKETADVWFEKVV